MDKYEIIGNRKLLDESGNLEFAGWARFPYLEPNVENINIYPFKSLQYFRLKRWQYYGITKATHFFSFTLSNAGYLGLVFAYVVDFEKKAYHEETLNVPFGKGIELPRDSLSGTASFKKGEISLTFETREDRFRLIDVNWPNFGKQTLTARLKITIPEQQESVVNVFPFDKKRFFYTRKVNCMMPEGEIVWDKTYQITPEDSFGTLDWGIGVWPYRSSWIWGSFSKRLNDGRTLGINLGHKIGKNPEIHDNAVILNGRVDKLPNVVFDYDARDYEREWRIYSSDRRLQLSFKPILVRFAKTDLLILKSVFHQIFGYYEGTFITESGEKIDIQNTIGWIEEHEARW